MALTGLITATSSAATISWGASFVVDDPTDISNPDGSTVVEALDFNNEGGTGEGDDNTINGILFTESAAAGFGSVNWIEGGTTAWVEAGYPTER